MPLLTPGRVETEELLDEHDAPRDDMERSLRDLRWINFLCGGIRIYRMLLRKLAGKASRLKIVDVGTGTADLLEAVQGEHLRIGIDFKIDHLLYQRDGSQVRRVVGDARRLPFRTGAVDVVTSAHFFHHFSAEENTAILGESLRVARIGVAVNDTQRHYAPLLFVRLMSALRLFGRITRFDAPASVLRAYTVREARAVVARVPASRGKVVRAFPFRFGILLWK